MIDYRCPECEYNCFFVQMDEDTIQLSCVSCGTVHGFLRSTYVASAPLASLKEINHALRIITDTIGPMLKEPTPL